MTLQTFGEFFDENPDLDPLTIPEDKRVFSEPGRYSVHLAGPMGTDETVEIQVYSNGGYTILDHKISKHHPKKIRA